MDQSRICILYQILSNSHKVKIISRGEQHSVRPDHLFDPSWFKEFQLVSTVNLVDDEFFDMKLDPFLLDIGSNGSSLEIAQPLLPFLSLTTIGHGRLFDAKEVEIWPWRPWSSNGNSPLSPFDILPSMFPLCIDSLPPLENPMNLTFKLVEPLCW